MLLSFSCSVEQLLMPHVHSYSTTPGTDSSGRATLLDGNCMCRVGKVQVFSFLIIPYSVFCRLPVMSVYLVDSKTVLFLALSYLIPI